ncbi:MAG: hypothetical protein C4523_20350 [Myxococcales bacterium]|nr:MAG: hypothetical protein C4523_20350 [Myxococcales bacterium]
MKAKRIWLIGLSIMFGLVSLLSACNSDDENTEATDGDAPADGDNPTDGDECTDGETIEVNADITADATWAACNTYILKKHIFVENATLTIEKGVTVKGESGSSLVIATSAKLLAEGDAANPIVFTSAQPEGSRAAGDWGGVVLLGLAPINVSGGSEKIEGFPATEGRTSYGGGDGQHDCGTLKYVRVEFAGFELAPDNELNGVTLGGCGSKTLLDHVQVHMGADDGVECFGGSANLKHVVISEPDDDGLDWDFGWTGKVQWMVVHQNGVVGDKGMECDNNKNDNDAAPRSAPELWNVSLIGSDSDPGTAGKEQSGIHFRRGTAGKVNNMIMAYFTDFGINVSDGSTVSQFDGGALAVKNSLFWDIGDNNSAFPAEPAPAEGEEPDDGGFDEAAAFAGGGLNNAFADPQLTDISNYDDPDFLPQSGSPALDGGATPPSDGFFDASATYIGAFGAEDWTAGWTAYPAN